MAAAFDPEDAHGAEDFPSIIVAFQELIESDAEVLMLFHQMFEQMPRRPPYRKNPAGKPQVRDYHHMLQLLNTAMTHPPEYGQTGPVG